MGENNEERTNQWSDTIDELMLFYSIVQAPPCGKVWAGEKMREDEVGEEKKIFTLTFWSYHVDTFGVLI